MYDTTGSIVSASEYGRVIYANKLNIYFKYNIMWRKYFLCTRYVYEVPFLVLWNSTEDTPKTVLWLMTHV